MEQDDDDDAPDDARASDAGMIERRNDPSVLVDEVRGGPRDDELDRERISSVLAVATALSLLLLLLPRSVNRTLPGGDDETAARMEASCCAALGVWLPLVRDLMDEPGGLWRTKETKEVAVVVGEEDVVVGGLAISPRIAEPARDCTPLLPSADTDETSCDESSSDDCDVWCSDCDRLSRRDDLRPAGDDIGSRRN